MARIHVTPKEIDPETQKLVKVPDPEVRGGFLPDEGRVVADSAYWRRRESAGEVKVEPVEDEPRAE